MSTSNESATASSSVLSELKDLVAEAQTLLSESNATPSAEEVDSLRCRCENAQKRLGEMYSNTKKRVVEGAHQADESIRQNPYQSAAVALLAGVIVGVWIGRRR